MCGRFTLHHSMDQIVERFAVEDPGLPLEPRYNIAPSQPLTLALHNNRRRLDIAHWGLVPFWAKDPKMGRRMINARAETLAEKPAFKGALKYRRCLIPASGYYEWQTQGEERVPTYIRPGDAGLLAMAGLWEEWSAPEGETLRTCTIVTTQANAFTAPIHHRMPLLLTPAQEAVWLDPQRQNPADLAALLTSKSELPLVSHSVSKQVNIPTFDDPSCIEPLAA
ncbi:MAG: hypothetical protein GKR89_29650 [Candidatus Latescibacteria bacterium]|nr:hypothetical protein [Candidatus Latescibacterota bacterium]